MRALLKMYSAFISGRRTEAFQVAEQNSRGIGYLERTKRREVAGLSGLQHYDRLTKAVCPSMDEQERARFWPE